jgi:hypothetical protein
VDVPNMLVSAFLPGHIRELARGSLCGCLRCPSAPPRTPGRSGGRLRPVGRGIAGHRSPEGLRLTARPNSHPLAPRPSPPDSHQSVVVRYDRHEMLIEHDPVAGTTFERRHAS